METKIIDEPIAKPLTEQYGALIYPPDVTRDCARGNELIILELFPYSNLMRLSPKEIYSSIVGYALELKKNGLMAVVNGGALREAMQRAISNPSFDGTESVGRPVSPRIGDGIVGLGDSGIKVGIYIKHIPKDKDGNPIALDLIEEAYSNELFYLFQDWSLEIAVPFRTLRFDRPEELSFDQLMHSINLLLREENNNEHRCNE